MSDSYIIRYTTKWPYFQNLSFLETIVSVRGSNTSQNNSAGDYNETNEYTVVSEQQVTIIIQPFMNPAWNQVRSERKQKRKLLKYNLNFGISFFKLSKAFFAETQVEWL